MGGHGAQGAVGEDDVGRDVRRVRDLLPRGAQVVEAFAAEQDLKTARVIRRQQFQDAAEGAQGFGRGIAGGGLVAGRLTGFAGSPLGPRLITTLIVAAGCSSRTGNRITPCQKSTA